MARERAQRTNAALCPPHPRSRLYMSKEDWATPSERRCGRCHRAVKDDAAIEEDHE
jgi:hypothetical protein